MINRLTADLVWSWHPCPRYPRARIDAIYGVDGLTPLQVCDLSDVSAEDKLWTLLREEVLPAATLRLLASKWIDAWAAAWAAARAAGWAAARAAARDAARDAAWAAARDAQLADVRNILAEDEHD